MKTISYVEILGIWVSAAFVLMMITYVFKETYLFRFAEHTFIGLSMGHVSVQMYETIRFNVITPFTLGSWSLIVPIVLGLILYLRWINTEWTWISRYPLMILLGTGLGLSMRTIITSNFIRQITATLKPLGTNPFDNFNIILGVFMVVVCMYYFMFTRADPKPFEQKVFKLGRVFLMITFGAIFGNVVMQRYNTLIQVLNFLIRDWLHLA